MRKLYVLIFLLLFSACGTQPEEEIHITPEEDYTSNYQMVEIEGIMRKIMPPGSLTTEHFLEDLDYMVYVLQNNFALLDVANWAHGVDYAELAEEARQRILTMDEPCEDMFLAIMVYSFRTLFGTGHFRIFVYQQHYNMVNNFYGGYRGLKGRMNLALMHSPLAKRFYYDSGNQERTNSLNEMIEMLEDTYGTMHNRWWVEDGISQPVTTKIIEENRIAYISLGRSMEELWQSRNLIREFNREIADFEHLILDLRGNGGGDINNFLNFVLIPHLRESIEPPKAFYFFLDGPYIRRFGDMLFDETVASGFLIPTEVYSPAMEILEEFDLPEINHIDIERLDYGVPVSRRGRLTALTEHSRFAFDGKIWLLTDKSMGSASTMAAWYARETGFATLVGDYTGGNLGGPRTLALMPNTGIIFYFDIFYVTDSRGRPLEAGTIPHHFRRPGLCPLETVLELIAEGEY